MSDDPHPVIGPGGVVSDEIDGGASRPVAEGGRAARIVATIRARVSGARTLSLVVWVLLLVGCGIVFFSRQRGDLARLDSELRGASIGWLIPALVVELLLLGTMALQQKVVYQLLGQRLPYRTLLSLLLRRMMIATLVPGGAPLSVAMQVRRLSDRGVPVGTALFGELFSGAIGTVSFVSVLIPVAVALVIGGSANIATVAATGILTVACVVIVTLFALALRPQGAPRWMTRWLPGRLRDGLHDARAQGVTFARVVPAFLVALVVDFLGVLVLYLSIRAIHDHVSLMDVLVGYTVGSAFIFITPVFGGFGVVELSMATALTARGLPPASALGGVLIYRSFELWLPLLLGIANEPLIRRGSTLLAGVGVRTLPLRLPAIATGVIGLLSVLSTTRLRLPAAHHLHHHVVWHQPPGYWLFALPELSRSASLLAGVLLLALAWGLWRRKRAAWAMSLVMLAVAASDDIIRHHGTPLVLLIAATVALLIWRRDAFRVRTDVPTVGGAVLGVVAALAFAFLYGTIGFFLLDVRDFDQDFGLWEAFSATIRQFAGLGQSDLVPHTRYAHWFLDSITMVGILSVGIAGFAVWRPIAWRARNLPAERAQAQAMILRYGDSSLDTFKGWNDKLFFFNEAGDGLVAFALSNGCAVALGGPVAASDAAFSRTLAEFVVWCDTNGWTFAFHQASPERVGAYRVAGLRLLKIGEEAVVDLTTFSLDGRPMKAMRSALRRLEREGYRAVVHAPPHAPELMAELREVSDAWLTLEGRRERGFTLGQWSDAYIGSCPVVTLEAADGTVMAFANLIGDGAPGEATLDMMRRRRDAPNAAMDSLFVEMFAYCRRQGSRRFSLGMVPWVALGGEPTAPAVERAIRYLNDYVERFFSVAGLYHYKNKFGPLWSPRYLVYRSDLDLARIMVAVVRLTEREAPTVTGWNGFTEPAVPGCAVPVAVGQPRMVADP